MKKNLVLCMYLFLRISNQDEYNISKSNVENQNFGCQIFGCQIFLSTHSLWAWDKIISNVFLLLISWEEKSKVMLGPKILSELGDEIEGSWLELVFKVGKDLVGGINADGRSSLRWWVNLEEEWCEVGLLMLEEIYFNAGKNW